jgi:hypothetical protein
MMDANEQDDDDEYRYDPERDPDPEMWLELDEGERIHLVEQQHRAARERVPNLMAHAGIHVAVENQIAMGTPDVVVTMQRLLREGLMRHDALHAVGSVLAGHMFEILKAGSMPEGSTFEARYAAELARLNAASLRAS